MAKKKVPFVDDCAEDAALKAASARHAHLAHAWPCHGGELRKLLHALFGWRAEQPGREVGGCLFVRHGLPFSVRFFFLNDIRTFSKIHVLLLLLWGRDR